MQLMFTPWLFVQFNYHNGTAINADNTALNTNHHPSLQHCYLHSLLSPGPALHPSHGLRSLLRHCHLVLEKDLQQHNICIVNVHHM